MTNICISCKYFNTCGDVERVEPCKGYFNGATTLNAIDHELSAARIHRDSLKEERAARRERIDAAKKEFERAAADYNAFAVLPDDRCNTYVKTDLK